MSVESRYRMSQERLEELKKELEYLQTVREKEVSEQIKEARSFGDLSENSEYDEAKTEQGKLYSKIAEIKNLIENAVILENVPTGSAISMGSRVTVREVGEEDEETYEIVGSQEANPILGRIADESPLGRSLMGKKSTFEELVNHSVNQSARRTVITTVTTVMALGVMCIISKLYGLDSIFTFAFPLMMGMSSGVYTSLCVSTSAWVVWSERKKADKN